MAFSNGLSLVRAEIVEDDDVARHEGRHENLLDVLEEALAIDGRRAPSREVAPCC
jgi:hypothetical protein